MPDRRRLGALALAVLVALQPAGTAWAGCGLRSVLSGGSCCCRAEPDGNETAVVPGTGEDARSCCASRAPKPEIERREVSVRRAAEPCECSVRAPFPAQALPRASEARGCGGEQTEILLGWIAAGSRESAATPCLPLFALSDGRGPPRPATCPSADSLSAVPSALARLSGRGLNGLLAVLGIALR